MTLEPDEVQILKGPGLTVTDRRVIGPNGALAVTTLAAPRIDPASVPASATPLVATIGLGLAAAGFLIRVTPLWIVGLTVAAFSPLARIRRPGYTVSAEIAGERKPVYSTQNEGDAKLAAAALTEALARAGQTPVEGR